MLQRLKILKMSSDFWFLTRVISKRGRYTRVTPPLPEEGVSFEPEAEAYCRQLAGTLTPGIGPSWDPWPYICSMSRPLFFFLSLVLLIDEGGVGLIYID
jgi:hypothetical protein